ncbi:hypothetical protein EDC96DRAFT_574459 [Choanephora cucurbitarum]|nr:hypothetical protein EDC96DRAFT_574459 [Choanephora cucurbitarum]
MLLPPKETLQLPSIVDKMMGHKEDIQGTPIVLSPMTESNLPKPIQPSIISMEAVLPTLLQSDAKDGTLNAKLLLLPPPPSFEPIIKTFPKSIRSLLNPIPPNRTIKGFKQYRCSFCQKKFMRPSSLKIHIYSHTGEKPFHCSFSGCRRKFSVQSNMRRHLRVHLN